MSKCIAMSEVIVPRNRQRRVFAADKLHEFGDAISKLGLLHPILLRKDVDPNSPLCGHLILVAGERRLRAVTDLADLGQTIRHDGTEVPLGQIPYTMFEELDPLAAEEAELDENLNREDLTWQERASAIARLHALRTSQAAAGGLAPPTAASIALEVRGSDEGSNQATIRRDLIVARHLGNPEVAGAKSADEAFKFLVRAESAERSRALGESVGRTFTADLHRCINADALEWLVSAPEEAFDVVLTDPPYGMGADEFGDSGGLAAGAHSYADTQDTFERILTVCAAHLGRVTKPQAHLYWFCDIGNFEMAKMAFEVAGWWVFRTPLIWHKPGAMRAPWPQNGPQRKYETILYAVKGKRNVLKMGGDLFAFPPDSNLGHAAQKPVALFKELLSRSARPGDSVLDLFCGSGTIFPAAHELKCRATGVEISQSSYGLAVKRIEGLKNQLELAI